ncbi:hypothetical protein [Nevskia sp.]|uniref:hypothetical protein n=1 Tax=Nevskia sp. TaxID=1929292 RepID=UPI0025DBF82C|nr:hypothetical protein [Nevskia sp.]
MNDAKPEGKGLGCNELLGQVRTLKAHLMIKSEEHDCCAQDMLKLKTATNALLHQIDIGDFVDSHGHSAKMLKPVHDLMRLLERPNAEAKPLAGASSGQSA